MKSVSKKARGQGKGRKIVSGNQEAIRPRSYQTFGRTNAAPPRYRGLEAQTEDMPTSDRIPGSAPADDFMHAHKIAPAYNKGALQYLPEEKDD